MEPLTVSVHEASKALGIGLTTTWAHIKSGKLQVARLGGRTLVTVESIKRAAQPRHQ